MKPKICIYAIALNEEKFADRFMDHCNEADLVVVCDTGSSDRTVELLKARGAFVTTALINPWRFDVARNIALSLVPKDVDICITLDLDECIQPGWRIALENAWKKNSGQVGIVKCDYTWSWKSDSTPDVNYYHEKVHNRNNYAWKYPCHEVIYCTGSKENSCITIPEIKIHHYPDHSKSRGSYLNLLKIGAEEVPANSRMKYYYARELFFYGRYVESIEEFNNYLTLPLSTWSEERSVSYLYISQCYSKLGNLEAAQKATIKAILENDNIREPWLFAARVAYNRQDWITCNWAAKKCIKVAVDTQHYFRTSDCWGYEPYDLIAISSYNLELYKEAYNYGKRALELNPEDGRLNQNLVYYSEKVQ
jgi:glycosyltransferase involved in cell wall biosynthesis